MKLSVSALLGATSALLLAPGADACTQYLEKICFFGGSDEWGTSWLSIAVAYQGVGGWMQLTSGFDEVHGDGCLYFNTYLTVDPDEGDAILFQIVEDDFWTANDIWYYYENHFCDYGNFWNHGGVCPPAGTIDYNQVFSCSVNEPVTVIANAIKFYPDDNRRLTDMADLEEGGMEGKKSETLLAKQEQADGRNIYGTAWGEGKRKKGIRAGENKEEKGPNEGKRNYEARVRVEEKNNQKARGRDGY
jgi:hypothetical protein